MNFPLRFFITLGFFLTSFLTNFTSNASSNNKFNELPDFLQKILLNAPEEVRAHCIKTFDKRFYIKHPSLSFPSIFKKGTAVSFYQNGGDKWGKSNWNTFECKRDLFGRSPIDNKQKVGISVNYWEKAIEDIALIKELGCNALRFSVEWTSIEPEEGVFNEEALKYYSIFIDELIKAGIEPSITLHHFTHPLWFEEKGGFEKEENIHYFVRFSAKIFERFASRVPLWFTINEPGVQSFAGYIFGIFSPGKFLNFHAAGKVLKNLLNAHVEVYKTLKKLPYGDKVQIGLVHQLLKALPHHTRPIPFLVTPLIPLLELLIARGLYLISAKLADIPPSVFANLLNFSAANEQIFNFLKTGEFSYKGYGINIHEINQDAPKSYDFIGINYYSRIIVGPLGPTCYPGEIMTDMEYAIYPKGIYDAIVEASQLGVPVYITENGIADSKDDRRSQFIYQYLNAVHAALEDGYDVRGYYYWSLMDNFEWQRGFERKFGLYEVDHKTQQRTLREGSKIFRDYFKIKKELDINSLNITPTKTC